MSDENCQGFRVSGVGAAETSNPYWFSLDKACLMGSDLCPFELFKPLSVSGLWRCFGFRVCGFGGTGFRCLGFSDL